MNITILGGGIAGMLAAYAFRRARPTLVEASPRLGGAFTAGGLKYLHHSRDMVKLLKELDIPWEPYTPRGRLNIDGDTFNHPEAMAEMNPVRRHQIQLKHWSKTRATELGLRDDCMNDPLGNHAAMRCDHIELLRKLEAKIRDAGCDVRLGSKVVSIMQTSALDGRPVPEVRLVEGLNQIAISYDVLIPTIPLGALHWLTSWANLPKAEATKLLVVDLDARSDKHTWDYMYTPTSYWVSRVAWPEPKVMTAEVPWYLVQSDFVVPIEPNDLNVMAQVAGEVRTLTGIDVQPLSARIIPGHLRPLDMTPVWPRNWYPLGRFAEWDSRSTADKVYGRALSLASTLRADR